MRDFSLFPVSLSDLGSGVASFLFGGDGDWSRVLVLTPSQRAGRVLRGQLIQWVTAQGRAGILLPMISTPAGLANHGLDQQAVADDLQAMLAWVAVLRAVPVSDVKALFPAPFVLGSSTN